MAQKEPRDDGPSLELPSFGLGRKRKGQRPPETDAAAEPVTDVEAEPAREPATEPQVAQRPEGAAPSAGETGTLQLREEQAPAAPSERRGLTLPTVGGMPASLITGAIIGVLTVGATRASLRLCEVVQGTSSCGKPGFFLLLAIMAVMVLLGRLLLNGFGVPEPGSTSLLGVGVLAVIALVFLVNLLFEWWMILVIPGVAMGSYALSYWVTTTFTGADPRDSMHR